MLLKAQTPVNTRKSPTGNESEGASDGTYRRGVASWLGPRRDQLLGERLPALGDPESLETSALPRVSYRPTTDTRGREECARVFEGLGYARRKRFERALWMDRQGCLITLPTSDDVIAEDALRGVLWSAHVVLEAFVERLEHLTLEGRSDR